MPGFSQAESSLCKISALSRSSLSLNPHPAPVFPGESSPFPSQVTVTPPSCLRKSLVESPVLTEQRCMWCPSSGWESGRNYFSSFFFFMFSSQNGWGSPDPFLHFSVKSVFVCARVVYLLCVSLVCSCQEKVWAAGEGRDERNTRQSSSNLVK